MFASRRRKIETDERKEEEEKKRRRREREDWAYNFFFMTVNARRRERERERERGGNHRFHGEVGLFVGCLTSQQHASVSQGRICSDNFMCCHTEIEAADHTFYLTQSQYTDTGPTSPSADSITPGAWQGSHWNANF